MVINMYTYYIFNIKEEFKDLYGDNPSGLYNILNNIKNIKYDEANFGITFLKQLTRKIEKQHLDNYLFIKMHKEAIRYINIPQELEPKIIISTSNDKTVKLIELETGKYIDTLRQISIKYESVPIGIKFNKENNNLYRI